MEKTIYEQAIEKFGIEKQIDMLIEEMAELTQALLKYRRKQNQVTLENIWEEFVDVTIVMRQIELTLNPMEIDSMMSCKLDKLQRLIEKP